MTNPAKPKKSPAADGGAEDTPASASRAAAANPESSSETEEEDTPTGNNSNNKKQSPSTPVPLEKNKEESFLLDTLVAAATMSSEKADAIRSKSNKAKTNKSADEEESNQPQEHQPSPAAAADNMEEDEEAKEEAKGEEEEKLERIDNAAENETANNQETEPAEEAVKEDETKETAEDNKEDADSNMEENTPIAEPAASKRPTRKRAPPQKDSHLAAEEAQPSPPKRAARSKPKAPAPASAPSTAITKKASASNKNNNKKKPAAGAGAARLNSTVALLDIFAYFTSLEKKEWMIEQEWVTKDLPAGLRKRLVNFRTEGKTSRESRLSHLNCLKANMLGCAIQSYGFTWNLFAKTIPSYTESALEFPKSTKRFRVLGAARDADRAYHGTFFKELEEFMENNLGMEAENFGTLIQLSHLHHLLYYHVLDSTFFSVEEDEANQKMNLDKAFGKFCYRAKSFFENFKTLFESVIAQEEESAKWDFAKAFPAGNPSVRQQNPDPGVGLKTPLYQTMQWVLFYCPYLLWNPNNLKLLDQLPDDWKHNQTEAKVRETFWKEATADAVDEEDGDSGKKAGPKNKQQKDICKLGQDAYLGIPAFVCRWKSGDAATRESLKALFPKMKELVQEYEVYLPVLKSSSDETFMVYFQNEFSRLMGNHSASCVAKLSRLKKQREIHAAAMAKIDEEIAALEEEQAKEEALVGGDGEKEEKDKDDNNNNNSNNNNSNGRNRPRRGGLSEEKMDGVEAVAV